MKKGEKKLKHLAGFVTLQSRTGKYREIQANPCNENRGPAMRTGVPCNEDRFFPVGIDLQGFPVSCTGFGFAVQLFSIFSGDPPAQGPRALLGHTV